MDVGASPIAGPARRRTADSRRSRLSSAKTGAACSRRRHRVVRRGCGRKIIPGRARVLRRFHAEAWDKLVYVPRDTAVAAVADTRPDSPTLGHSVTSKIGDPPGRCRRLPPVGPRSGAGMGGARPARRVPQSALSQPARGDPSRCRGQGGAGRARRARCWAESTSPPAPSPRSRRRVGSTSTCAASTRPGSAPASPGPAADRCSARVSTTGATPMSAPYRDLATPTASLA